jgi:O-antigen/teichoic acid export membrane protein
MDVSAEVRVATLVGSSMILAEALLSVVVVFHVAMRQQYDALVRLAANIGKLVLVFVLIATDAGLVPLVAAMTATLLAASLLAWVFARRRFGFRATWDPALVRPLLRDALPIWPAMLAGVLYLKLDALMVALLASRHDTGIYGAAYQPVEYVLLASVVILNVLFPLIARTHGRDPQQFVRVYRRGTEVLLAAMVPVAVVLLLSSRALTDVAYEARFQDAAGPMAVLGVALVFLALNAWQGLVLLAADRQRINVVYLSIAVVLNVGLDLALIPWVGPIGAAIGTLISGIALVGMSTFAVHRFAGATLGVAGIARVCAAGALLALTILGLRGLGVHWAIATVLGALSYPVWLAACGVFRVRDVRALLRPAGAPAPAAIHVDLDLVADRMP